MNLPANQISCKSEMVGLKIEKNLGDLRWNDPKLKSLEAARLFLQYKNKETVHYFYSFGFNRNNCRFSLLQKQLMQSDFM